MLIHLGFPKAASTWLQDCVFNNKKMGFTIPWKDSRTLAMDKFNIVNPFEFDANNVRSAFNNARIELNNHELVEVLSDETLGGNPLLWWMNARMLADRIFEVFPEAKIFICIREQKKIIWSLYSQYLKHGNTATLEQFIGAQGRVPGIAPVCDTSQLEYHKIIGYYQSLYGKDKVLVLTLEQLQENRDDFLGQLMSFSGSAKRSYKIDNVVSNRAHGAATLIVRRKLNHISSLPNYMHPKQPMSFRAVSKVSDVCDKLIPASVHAAVMEMHNLTINNYIKARFHESNKVTSTITSIDLKAFGYD